MKPIPTTLLSGGCLLVLATVIAMHAARGPGTVARDSVTAARVPASTQSAAVREGVVWDKSPFHRLFESCPGPAPEWAKDWALAGMYNNNGQIRVSLVNTQTGEYRHLNKQGPADAEFTLVEAHFDRDRNEAYVEVAKGREEQRLRYQPLTIAQAGVPSAPNQGRRLLMSKGRPGL